MAELTGIRAVKLPVSDLGRSRAWYARTLGYEPVLEFADASGVVRGTSGRLPGCDGIALSLRENPEAHGISGLELMLGVADRDALESWTARLDELGVAHSAVIDATLGWLVVLHDPDGHELHLYTDARHGIDQNGRAGYGRAVGAGSST